MLSIRHIPSYFALAIATAGVPAFALAGCVLPVPDGGIAHPSKPNVEGRIASVNQDVIVIGAKKVHVRITLDTALHTALGGIVSVGELKAGQSASVWFVGCKHPGKSVPVAAYFQVLSRDPNDQP